MKRIVLLFVIAFLAATLGSQAAEAQRSGSMQATARVVDTRESWAGLRLVRELAARLAGDSPSSSPVMTSLSQVSIALTTAQGGTTDSNELPRRRRAEVTIQFLRN